VNQESEISLVLARAAASVVVATACPPRP
jgi:hypothetical protein